MPDRKARILLDTNFLMDVAKFRIDMWSEFQTVVGMRYEAAIIPGVEAELRKLAERGNRYAKAAVWLADMGKIRKLRSRQKGRPDNVMARMCGKDKSLAVATNDRELRKRLKDMEAKVIYIRSKKHLAMD